MNIKGSVLLLKEGKVIDSDYILDNIQGFSNLFHQFYIINNAVGGSCKHWLGEMY